MTSDANAELVDKISVLRKQRNAVILAHNYQRAEVQDIADFVGDSLELSQQAAKTNAAVIVFCGVHFMAETASILCPDKTVLLPDIHAGCPMANMLTSEKLIEKKKENPDAAVVCYINSSASAKAESDVCCTSANALQVAQKVEAKKILFVPDQYLGHFISTQVPDKEFIFWPGYCPTHAKIRPEDILQRKKEHPKAKAVVHPECRPDVIAVADAALSTGGMMRFCRETDAKEVIIGTEIGIIHRLKKENPEKQFIPVSEKVVCPNMKLITLEKIMWALEDMSPEVRVPEDIRIRAKAAVDKMLLWV